MDIPTKLTFLEGLYFTDGGSIVLIGEATDGSRHQITLGQHRFLEVFDLNLLPGRLYFDHLLVPVRSDTEAKVMALLQAGEILTDEAPKPEIDESTESGPVVIVGDDLKEYYAKVAEGMGETIRHLIENVITFVKSREYVKIAKKIEKKVGGDK